MTRFKDGQLRTRLSNADAGARGRVSRVSVPGWHGDTMQAFSELMGPVATVSVVKG